MPKFGVNTHSCALRRLALGASSLAFGAALAASPALAQQTAANTPSSGIETVTVTAQYVTQNVQSTPLAISVVTAQDLDQRGIVSLSQISASVPSLTLNPAPAAFGNGLQAFIRGVGAFDTAFEHEPGVGTYIDDIYFGTLTGSELDLMDLNRIEVLKGPQGVLGGKNNEGGAIRMYTQKPTEETNGYLEGTYGSFNEIYLKGATNLTLIPGHLFMRVSATSKNQDGFVNVVDFACANPSQAGSLPRLASNPSCKLGTQGGTNVHAGRVALRAVVNAHLEDNLAVDVVRDDSEVEPDTLYAVYAHPPGLTGPADPGVVYYNNGSGLKTATPTQFGLGTASATPGFPLTLWANVFNPGKYGIPWDQRFIPNNPYKTTFATYTSENGGRYTDGNLFHSWSLTNTLDYDIFDWMHLKVITGYRYFNSGYSDDSDVSPLSFQLTTTYTTSREFQQEERFTGTLFDNKLEWTAGAFTYYRENRATGPVILDAFYDFGLPFLVFEQNDTYKNTNNSGYVHLIYHLFDNVDFFGGARYTSESKAYFFNHSAPVPGYPGSGFFVDPTPHISTTERPDWRAGVDYHVTSDVMAYFQFSTGYRTGGTNSRPFSPLQLKSYGPEHIKSYEVGAKTQWFDDKLRANIALYSADYSNVIIPFATKDSGGAPYVQNLNLGSQTNKGVELELTAAPIDNLLLNATFSHISVTTNPAPGAQPGFLDGCSPAAALANICSMVQPGTVPVGSPPTLYPQNQFYLSAQYAWQLGNDYGSLTPRLDYTWQGITYQSATPATSFLAVPAHGILDAHLTWDAPQGGWQVMFAVTNLTDKKYFYDMFNLAAFGFGTVTGNPAPPREWSITLKKSF
ncbi:MAG TPA: TonB-dependent receptor [Rhizomicrobium sp.]|nr:TonB-dependent receptor [Rhizomicrobium sp.]